MQESGIMMLGTIGESQFNDKEDWCVKHSLPRWNIDFKMEGKQKKKDNSLQKIGSEINRNNNYVSVVFITV